MKKFELVEALKENGFSEMPIEGTVHRACVGGVILQRTWSQEIEVAWYGKHTETYTVRVFVNQPRGVCEVTYMKNGITYKARWYDTIGKRTYNAVVETARCAGYEF